MKFGDRDYAIFDLAGTQTGPTFCTVEELVKGSDNRTCTYSSEGALLSESRLEFTATHLEVNALCHRAIIYSYGADSVMLFDLERGAPMLWTPCEELNFLQNYKN